MAMQERSESDIGKKIVWTIVIIFVLLVLVFSPINLMPFTIVPAGHVGVYDLFGSVRDTELDPGFHIVNPLAAIHKMSVQTLEATETAVVPSKEGLSVSVDVSVLYHLVPEQANEIYKTVGVDYPAVIIEPQIRSVIRGVTVNHEAKALYTSERELISEAVTEELKPMLEQRGVILEKILLRGITLPETVSHAIEAKLSAEQEAEKMKFILEKEKFEADRKRTEAQGIADANKIIGNSLTPNYLTWYWISNLGKANSVMYVPVGDSGMPLFKDVDRYASQSASSQQSVLPKPLIG